MNRRTSLSPLALIPAAALGLTFALGQPGSSGPACKVVNWECTDPGSPWCSSQSLRICDMGLINAPQGQQGRIPDWNQQEIRTCKKYSSTIVWDCNSTPPSGPWIKLTLCGAESGNCCYGKGESTEQLQNSYRQKLSTTPCTGTGGGGQ
ncbi:MAG: hypothetical protein HRU70_06850 [Phycisphaeraceae bacterium]|nr:MAG: hypothetical protein HRU70_06850 [Phycisphaeraceae bacterium]